MVQVMSIPFKTFPADAACELGNYFQGKPEEFKKRAK